MKAELGIKLHQGIASVCTPSSTFYMYQAIATTSWWKLVRVLEKLTIATSEKQSISDEGLLSFVNFISRKEKTITIIDNNLNNINS